MAKKQKLLRGYLIFGGCYFIFDALLHLSNSKLLSVEGIWPTSAVTYAQLLDYIYASFVLLAASFSFITQMDLKKYKNLIVVSSIWAIFHGLILLNLVWVTNYQQIFQNLPSLLVWLPFYREYLSLNALLLFVYSGVVFLWLRSKSE